MMFNRRDCASIMNVIYQTEDYMMTVTTTKTGSGIKNKNERIKSLAYLVDIQPVIYTLRMVRMIARE